MVIPSRRITSTPMAMGFGAGFAMAPKMAMEAMRKMLVCMMDGLMVLEFGTIDKTVVLIVDVLVVFVVDCDFSRTSGKGRVFYIYGLARWLMRYSADAPFRTV